MIPDMPRDLEVEDHAFEEWLITQGFQPQLSTEQENEQIDNDDKLHQSSGDEKDLVKKEHALDQAAR